MSNNVIQVENLGKKYLIGRDRQKERYKALRDVIVDSVSSLSKKLLDPWSNSSTLRNQEEFWALKDISFEVKQGEVLGIIGRNGAGKSTLLKVISRITEPSLGKVTMKGRVASLLEVGTGFHPELTGRENIYLNGSILGMHRYEIKRKFDEIVNFAEVEKFLDTPVKRYSSGMYTRLAFAVAAHLEPEILVVDEVLSVGDAAFQDKCLGKIENIATKEGRTVLFVSHNLGTVSKLCSLCLYLDNGKVVAIGGTSLVVKQYADHSFLTPSSVQLSTAESSKDIHILEVAVKDKFNCESPSFSFSQDFYLSVTYKLSKEVTDLCINCLITDSNGINVLLSSTTDYASYINSNESIDVGTYKSQVLIFGHLLFIGKYYVDVSITIAGHEVANIQQSLGFEITPEGEVNHNWQIRPIIYPNLLWQTECLLSAKY